ncbi:unnamed protein product [marine sediment metagenome]|uniref:Uncharacterized protein n=1 Tax=marine sediment metagenome TaxID=412755 RepID=X1J815_9ZZZZ
MNPEKVLEEIAIAIKHRCPSTTLRWYIIWYYGRISCVPSNFDTPVKFVLGEFTERMVEEGFTVVYWNQLKTNITQFHKEIYDNTPAGGSDFP